MTFSSVTSPVMIPAFTVTDAGVTVYVLSSTIAAVATGPCAQPRVMTATAPIKAATPAHFDIVISLPRR